MTRDPLDRDVGSDHSGIEAARGFSDRLTVPLVVAPMFQVSSPELVVAACRAGAIGAFPTANCRSLLELDEWLSRIRNALSPDRELDPPVCANLIVRQSRLDGDLDVLLRHHVELVITSVGSPAPVVRPLQRGGTKVYADVASLRHVDKALEAGVDGLVLLTAGAGGQTGWANPFAFVRAVRRVYDGPVVLAGGVGDGRALWAAQVLGADLAYMGTRFIATVESLAAPQYKEMLVASTMDDVTMTRAFTGLDTNFLRPSLVAAGVDPDTLNDIAPPDRATFDSTPTSARRWTDLWSAGHSVSAVGDIAAAGVLVTRVREEYEAARSDSVRLGTTQPARSAQA